VRNSDRALASPIKGLNKKAVCLNKYLTLDNLSTKTKTSWQSLWREKLMEHRDHNLEMERAFLFGDTQVFRTPIKISGTDNSRIDMVQTELGLGITLPEIHAIWAT